MMQDPAQPRDVIPSHDRGNDKLAWLHATFQRLERPLLSYAMRLLGDIERSRDCVQESFLRLCREDQSHVEGHVDAWLFKTCRNRAMDLHRQGARMIFDSDSTALATAVDRMPEPIGLASEREQNACLQQQIASLSTREQEVLSLRLGQGLSYKQIADVMDLSVSHVGVILHQAVSNLRNAMAGQVPISQIPEPK